MAEHLGAWKNAPLAYVLAEVRTEQLADLKNYYADLAGAFRNQLPIQRSVVTARIIAIGGAPPTVEPDQDSAWELATPDNQVALIIRPNGFVLHATRYKDHSEFLGRFGELLNLISKRVPSIFMNRLGLRYVDFVIPRKGECPEDYVNARLNPQLDIDNTVGTATAMSLTIYPMNSGRLTLRYIRGTGQPQLPPELSTIALEKSPLMTVSGLDAAQPTAIVDIDRIREFATPEPMNPALIRREFQVMRDDISEIFKTRIITAHARKAWGAV